jgi:hypothetical protein
MRQPPVANAEHDVLMRKVTLRDERDGGDSRHLWAYLDDNGNLHIDGQDLGPGTAIVSTDGEYEWFQTIRATDVPRVRALLGEPAGVNILDALEKRWSGRKSGDLERRLRESDLPIERAVYGG